MKRTKINKILLAFILFEVLFSYFLVYDHIERGGFCGIGECDTVQKSSYAHVGRINLVYIAAIAFTLLLICYHTQPTFYALGVLCGGLFALYLISIQLFVLGAICSTCMLVDVSMLIIMGLTFYQKEYRKHLKGVFGRRP